MTRILLVEDRKMSRDSIIGYMKASDRYELAAQTAGAGMAEILCMQNQIDLILMDVCTANNEDGIDAAASIKKRFPNIKIIIVTGMTTFDLIDRAREAGADSFWYKEIEGSELIDVMDRTMAGEHIYPDQPPVVTIGNTTSADISQRELDVLRLMALGNTDTAIAEKLCVSVSAVRYHVTQLLQKTGYENRVRLIADLINKDFIVPGL
ncbi:MAG: response regulator transcription factor [Eubacteriales bacterium]|nr:response regulator transcription factor [Eubacteriales bacterium]